MKKSKAAQPRRRPAQAEAGAAEKLRAGLALHAQGRLAQAQALYQEALRLCPGEFTATHMLGVVALQTGQAQRGVDLIRQALAANPGSAAAHANLGNGLLDLKRPEEALACYDEALRLQPGYAQPLANRGLALEALGRQAQALESYRQAVQADPACADALNNQGNLLQSLRRHAEALACYEQALRAQPGLAHAWNNRGSALRSLQRPQEALDCYAQALRLRPGYVEALCNQGLALQDLKRPQDALDCYAQALQRKPDCALAFYNQGNALQELGRPEDALASYQQAVRLQPDYAEAWYNFGVVLQGLRRHPQALDCYERALRLRPDYLEALNNRGAVLVCLNRQAEARASYAEAVRLKPDYARGHWNESLARLVLGDFAAGFAQYEWRWAAEGFTSKKRDFAPPLWLGGEPLAGKTILLHAEQGLGDTLQFCRYAKQVAALGAEVVLEVQPPLKTLLQGLAGARRVLARGEPLPAFDCHCPLLSLPLAFATRLDSIPAEAAYLQADPGRAAAWRARLGGATGRPRIGLVWSGSPAHGNDGNRSIPLAEFARLAAGQGQFVSLQKQVREADLAVLRERPDILHFGDELGDFADTAALAANLDLVVAVDTAAAHLAAAQGLPVWLLLPFSPDWRWLLGRDDSPWYPGMRLFRQAAVGDWAGVVDRIKAALDALKPGAQALWTQALALHKQGRLAEAEALYREVARQRPGDFDAAHRLGVVALQAGDTREGVERLRQALALKPDDADAHSNLGNGLLALKRPQEALACYLEALRLQPGFLEACCNAGAALHALQRFEEALDLYDRALRLKPDYAEALSNRGAALRMLNRPQEAWDSYEQALRIKPDYIDALYNRGIIPQELGRHEEALACFAQALRVKPGHVDAHWNSSLSRLALGDFERGFAEYEWRWETAGFAPAKSAHPQPLWLGKSPLRGKTLLLRAEQGLGDTLQFCRYAPMAAALGAEVLLEVQAPLKTLLAGLAEGVRVFAQGEALPGFDCQCPLLSLPLAFDTRLDSMPAAAAYLQADPARAAAWRARLGGAERPCIGLAWSGSPAHKNDSARSIPLAAFARLAAGPGQFVSLQKQVREADLAALRERPDILHFGDALGDFADTAALLANLDLVVAVDTAVAHLAAAMGLPVWLLLPFNADWRWLLGREDSPWYPRMRLFRQPEIGDWDSVIRRVGAELAARQPPPARPPRTVANPPHPSWGAALALHGQGRLAEAQALYQEILRDRPGHFGALHMLGVIALQSGNSQRGVELIGQALALDPLQADAHSNLGNGWLALGRPQEALACYEQALRLAPDSLDALNNRGNALRALARPQEALASYAEALRLRPGHADVIANRGNALLDLDRAEEALACYEEALRLRPDFADALNNRGIALRDLKRPQEALASYDRALRLRPDYAEALSNRGNLLLDLRRPQDALASFDLALRLKPDYGEALYNRGNALQALLRHEAALDSYAQALRLKPDYAEAHWNRSLSRLVLGDYERGFAEYEWRWKKKSPNPPPGPFKQPLWLGGEPLAGKTILLHAEQGLGDTLQFCRYVKQVAALGAEVVLEVQAALLPLLAGLAGAGRVVRRGEPLPAFDCHCPLLSLPLAFATRLDNIPAEAAYLQADPERAAAWRARLGGESGQPRIGLAWSGNPEHHNDHNRSIPLAEFARLAAGPGQFVSLQKQVREADLAALRERPDILHFGDELGDFADTAALVAHLDLVVAVDTSVAHLAAALGKPVWLLLPFNPDWRWLLGRDDSPWYPGMRLFRQAGLGDWGGVIDRVKAALDAQAGRPAADLSALWAQALALHRQGRLAEAEALYQAVARHCPGNFDVAHMLGVVALQAGDTQRGVERVRQALALNPDDPDAHSNLGNGLLDLKRPQEALACYEQALRLAPGHFDALNNRGNALQALKRPQEALASYDLALRLKPDHAEALANRGNALLDLDRLEEALLSFDRSLALKPEAGALVNRGNALQGLRRHAEALDSYARALALRPDYPEAHWNASLSRLALGDFEGGFAAYEWRWRKSNLVSPLRAFPQPLWLGQEPLRGKTILLHAEQGLGDTLQFCRYARRVAALGADVVLEVQPALKPLLAGLEGAGRVCAKGEALPPFDCHCPLLSLPLAFATRLDSIPAEAAYLRADPERAAAWRARLGESAGPRIGLAWSGNAAHVNDRNRSMALARFIALAAGPGQFVSLQKQVREADLALLRERPDIVHFGEALADFADTAALVANLDLVLTVDTAVAHLAAALGKPVWLLLPFNADWRWLLERGDSPWYPSMRLFRQPGPGDWDGALARVRQELAVFQAAPASEDADALCGQAFAAHRQGRLGAAEALYQAVLQRRPGHFDALHMLGLLALKAGRGEQAAALIGQAVTVNPQHAEALLSLGNAWQQLGRPQAALACYEQALRLKPDYVAAMSNRGVALQELDRLEEARACYAQVLRLKPDSVEALNNQGNVLKDLERLDEALACYEQALRLKPDAVDAHYNSGIALQALQRHEEALACYAEALRIDPNYQDAHLNEGISRLMLGDFERGLRKYEWRWKKKALTPPPRQFEQPLWLGREPLRGKRILLYAEQGLGDTIQFCRYAKQAAALGAEVTLEVQAPLKRLLSEGLEGAGRVLAQGEPLPPFDCQCPLLSLPLAFDTRLDSVPAEAAYLRADPARAAEWQARLGARKGPVIGLAWSGNPEHKNDRSRSIPLAEFARLAAGPGRFVSLHQQVRDADLAALRERPDIAFFGDELGDFADTAALAANLDLVVAVDTSVAHLAAALGLPVWLLLPFSPDWRWMAERSDSPWYPSMRLFRQHGVGDWGGVLDRVAAELGGFGLAAARTAARGPARK